jgi:hypothetical protein
VFLAVNKPVAIHYRTWLRRCAPSEWSEITGVLTPSHECDIAIENGQHVLRNRVTGVEYARGTEAQVRTAAQGRHPITDAPRLGPVQPAGTTLSGHPEYTQLVAESKSFRGRQFTTGIDEWTAGVLYPDHLGIGFTERLADVPLFVLGVQQLTGSAIWSVSGTASVAGAGDPPLLGDWIRSGHFQPDRLALRFDQVLGGSWRVVVSWKDANNPASGYWVSIDRVPGTSP